MSDHEIEAINRKLDTLADSQKEVLYILQDGNRNNRKGLVSKVDGIEERLESFITQYNLDQAVSAAKKNVWSIVFGAIGTGLFMLGKFILGLIFK